MSKCPLCYGEMESNACKECGFETTDEELIRIKARTYDRIVSHLFQSGNDLRRREQIRTKIALKNIKRWAKACAHAFHV